MIGPSRFPGWLGSLRSTPEGCVSLPPATAAIQALPGDPDERPISEFQPPSAVSANPVIRFPLRATRSATLRVVPVKSEGRRSEVAQASPHLKVFPIEGHQSR